MTDEQQQTPAWNNPTPPDGAPLSEGETPAGTEPPPTKHLSRRMVLLVAGIGVSGASAIGAGAYAFYESQSANQNSPVQGNPGGRPSGGTSRMPRGDRSGMRTGARPSGAPSGGFPPGGRGGNASGMPTDQPT